ncbi:hypothetical protein KP509_26G056100 [Ceratopteris richardii]|nr:hypothetical protein KP509_26G056100 [Ceratopteris richardii]
MFANCGSLHEANLVFENVDKPNVHTWNAIMGAHVALGETARVFEMYNTMVYEGIKPDKFAYMTIIKACGNIRDLARGKCIHGQLLDSKFPMDIIMGSTLVDMYSKCGSLELAYKVFDNMSLRDKVTWNAMLGAYVRNGNGVLALKLFYKMQSEGINTDKVTFLNALKACTISGSLNEGKAIHELISRSEFRVDVAIGSTLIDMYTKCGSMDEAQRVFDNLPIRNVVTWSVMIAGYTELGHGHAALTLFDKMLQEGIKPDGVILACLLKACGSIKSVEHGNMLYEEAIRNGFEKDVFVGNNIFYMYAKAGCLKEARKVFDSLSDRDTISWATMIAGYAHNGQGVPALQLFKEMQRQGIVPDEVTYSCVLKACGLMGAFGEGKLIHDQCSKEAEADIILANTLIDMYINCGNLEAAHKLFDTLPNRDVISWNLMITAYANGGQANIVYELFEKMRKAGMKPTEVTFLGILKACAHAADLDYVKQVHKQLLSHDLGTSMMINNALIDTYAKCGGLELARELFSSLKSFDAVTWGVMIGGYVYNGDDHAAMRLFKRMQQEGIIPDNITMVSVLKACSNIGALEQGQLLHDYAVERGAFLDITVSNAFIDMYAKCSHIEKATEVFNDMPKRDVISWNTMIFAHTFHGNGSQALKLFEDMHRTGLEPDEVTLSCILKVCSSLAFIQQGRQMHDYIVKNEVHLSPAVINTLLDMYIKCGNLREAQTVFDSFHDRDIVSWGVLIGGYAQHGFLSLAKQCVQDMKRQGLKPDSLIHLSILASCSQAGLADEGYEYFRAMANDYDAPPGIEHFNTLVDLLGRAGRLEEAGELLQTIPSIPPVPAWVSLLTACQAYGNKGLAGSCFHELCQLDPNNITKYAMICDMHSAY